MQFHEERRASVEFLRWAEFRSTISSLGRGISLGHRGDEIEPVKPAARTRTARAAKSSKRGLSVLHVSKHFPALDVTQYST